MLHVSHPVSANTHCSLLGKHWRSAGVDPRGGVQVLQRGLKLTSKFSELQGGNAPNAPLDLSLHNLSIIFSYTGKYL